MKRTIRRLGVAVALAIALGGCASPTAPTSNAPTAVEQSIVASQPFALTSSAFEDGAPIPERYSCHGENASPPLAWSAPPPSTQSLALIMDDPDAVKVVGRVWDHWLLFNLPAAARSLAEGVPQQGELPDGSRHGKNSSGGLGYGGPCPPSGQSHGYVFTVYALDTVLELKPGATKAEILKAIDSHILGQAQLIGQYASP